jgi:hypothetical protein
MSRPSLGRPASHQHSLIYISQTTQTRYQGFKRIERYYFIVPHPCCDQSTFLVQFMAEFGGWRDEYMSLFEVLLRSSFNQRGLHMTDLALFTILNSLHNVNQNGNPFTPTSIVSSQQGNLSIETTRTIGLSTRIHARNTTIAVVESKST